MTKRLLPIVAIVAVIAARLLLAAQAQPAGPRIQLEKIKLPAGFHIAVYAEGVRGARSMTQSPSGTIFVGSQLGTVYALRDANKGNQADGVVKIATGLNQANGVAFRAGTLYVPEINRVLKFDNIESKL